MSAKDTISHGTRELLSSRLGFILIAAGCAIGLGNIWRFPYITGQNGGAVFVGIYLICLLIIGVPCVMMELAVGRASQRSVALAFNRIEPSGTKWHLAKYPMMLGPYVLMSFYTVLTGWLLYYLVSMAKGDFSNMHQMPVAEMTSIVSSKFSSLLADPFTMLSFTVAVITAGTVVCARGVQKGVELVTKPMMLLLLILLVGLAAYSLTLEGALEGVKYYLYPDFERASKVGWINVIYQALNQAFFTLSVGQGSLLIFGSYIDKKRSLAQESIVIAMLDTFVAIVAGLIIFPACMSFGIQPDFGPNLLFVSMLNVFASMEYGRIVGTVFFAFMFFAALTTVIAVMESIMALTMEQFNLSRRCTVFLNFLVILVVSIPCVLGFNYWSDVHPLGGESIILDLEDFIVSNNILPFGSLFFVIFCTFGWGFKNFLAEVNTGKGFALPKFIKFYVAFILPIIVAFILIMGYLNTFNVSLPSFAEIINWF